MYLNFLPLELIGEILLYSDVESIKNLAKLLDINEIIMSTMFWVNKLKLDGLDIYIQFLGETQDYQNFYNINNNISNFIFLFKKFNENLLFDTTSKIDIRDLINSFSLKKFGSVIDISKQDYYISIRYIYYNTYRCIQASVYGEYEIVSITESEFKLLLIKLLLVNIDIYSLSNLDDVI